MRYSKTRIGKGWYCCQGMVRLDMIWPDGVRKGEVGMAR
jgi:hypothetical protein